MAGTPIVAIFYKFAKRSNSTKRPDNSTPHNQLTIVIDDAQSSMLEPTIRLQYVVDEPYKYNYVFIPTFSRYYYITDWAFNGDGTWSGFCTCDHLATWKPAILSSGGYVARCPSTHVNNQLMDPLTPPTTSFLTVYEEYNMGLSANVQNGSFIIGVIAGGTATNIGATKYYLVSRSNLQTLVNNMVSTTTVTWGDVTNFMGDAAKSMINPIQFIVSCKWYPFAMTLSGVGQEQIYLWCWATGAYGQPLGNHTYINLPGGDVDDDRWSIINLPDVTRFQATAADYPTLPPYAQYSLITPWGTFDLNAEVMGTEYRNSNLKLRTKLIVNLISGSATFVCATNPNQYVNSDPYEFFRREVNMALDIPIAQASLNYVSAAKGAVSGLASAFNIQGWYTNAAGNIAGIANGVIDVASAMMSPSVQSTTTNSATFTPEIGKVRFQMTRYRKLRAAPTLVGNIYKMPVDHISTEFSAGFIQMDVTDFVPSYTVTAEGVSTTVTGTTTEEAAVREALCTGIYLE